jgi:alkylated DNA repair dioxygenase AlkB
MAQMSLFSAGPVAVYAGVTGTVTYHPDCATPAQAAVWFRALLDAVDWQHETRRMYDRDVGVPRLTAAFRVDDASAPAALREAAELVTTVTGARFNSIGLNLYRDGNDSVAMHGDRLGDLATDAPIALLSLGATRRMAIAPKQPPRRSTMIDLVAGSVLCMDHVSQLHLLHGIPKVREDVGARISLAFRRRLSVQ